MESSSSLSSSSCWCSWPIIQGCLDDVVTCESSISDDIDSSDEHQAAPLILRRPPSPDSDSAPSSSSCEITIVFTQLHEVKQIYVRSSAKVYEIYYNATTHHHNSSSSGNDNEYLCTVRCGIASTQEDDGWVDVNLQDSSVSLSTNNHCDRFEATAQLSDIHPVLSITLRLLSIQTGDCIYVDQIYIFADPVESTQDQTPTSTSTSSGGAALLSMFIPTLMHLSKSPPTKHSTSDAGETSIVHSTAAAPVTSIHTSKEQIIPTTISNASPLNLSHSEDLPSQTSISLYTQHLTNGNKVEETLEKLVSRVSKIEDICLRFEQNMLKPIIRMESRLERVEKQLESFFKSPQFANAGCITYSTPNCFLNDSNSNLFDTVGNDYPPAVIKSKSTETDNGCSEELSIPASDANSCANVQCHGMQSSSGDSHVHPGLCLTAPDFPCSDDKEENDSTEAVKDSSSDCTGRLMSVDGALAEFMSSALIKAVSCTPEMIEEAELVCVRGGGAGPTSGKAFSATLTRPLECAKLFGESENCSDNEWSGDIVVSASVDSDEHVLLPILDCNDETSCTYVLNSEKDSLVAVLDGEETTDADDLNDRIIYESGNQKPAGSTNLNSGDDLGKLRNCHLDAGTESLEQDDDAGEGFVSNFCDSPTFLDTASSDDVNAAALEVSGGSTGSPSREGVFRKGPVQLQDVIELSSPTIVDFSAPMLDVKFSSFDNASPIEGLFVDMPNIMFEDGGVREDDAGSCSKSSDLLVIEDDSSGIGETVNNQLFFFDDYKSVGLPLGAELQDQPYSSKQDTGASLI